MKALGEYVSKISDKSCQIKATSIPSLVLDPFHDCSSHFLLNVAETLKQSNMKTLFLLVSSVSYKTSCKVQREENSPWQFQWQIKNYKTGYCTITRSILLTFSLLVPTHVFHALFFPPFSHPLYAMWLRLPILLLSLCTFFLHVSNPTPTFLVHSHTYIAWFLYSCLHGLTPSFLLFPTLFSHFCLPP